MKNYVLRRPAPSSATSTLSIINIGARAPSAGIGAAAEDAKWLVAAPPGPSRRLI